MEQKISEDRILLAGKLSQSQHAFQISAGSSLVDLHNEHDEGFKRQLRKVTKSRSIFPTDDALFKLLYLAMMDITKKWVGKSGTWNWGQILNQLMIHFEGRITQEDIE